MHRSTIGSHAIVPMVCVVIAGLLLWWLLDSEVERPPDSGPESGIAPAPTMIMEEIAVRAISEALTPTVIYAQACALCHGARGEGNQELGSPSIAGQPTWYVGMQLRKFRNGQRGAHPKDRAGRQMATVARALPAESLDTVAEFVSRMPPFPTRKTLAGDSENGRLVYAEQCMECHRYNGQGELVFRSSPLTSFQDWYLANELEEFRTGVRGQDPDDLHGAKMRDVARHIDADARRDVIAYIAELASQYPPGR